MVVCKSVPDDRQGGGLWRPYRMAVRWQLGDHCQERSKEQEKIIKYIGLMAKAVIFQNIIDVARLLHDKMAEGIQRRVKMWQR
jgi:hypothetical protein